MIGGDGLKALFAMVFSYLYIAFHTRDFGLATIGMIHIMITIPVSLGVYIGPFGFDRFNTLCPLGIFVILGIGADDIFIVVDCWKQSLKFFQAEDLQARMAWTWKRSAHAMLTTTLTTGAAFMANGMSPIPPVAVFGIFTALLVFINYLFCITWFPAMIIVREKMQWGYWIPAYCGCCGVCAPISYFMYKRAVAEKELEDGKKAEIEVQDAEEEMGVQEKFLYEVFAPTIDKIKLPAIGVTAVVSIIFFIFAVQLKPAEDAAQFLPNSDPLQRNIDLGAHPDIGVFQGNSQQQFVNIYFGQDGINREDVDFLNAFDYGTLESSPGFEAAIATPVAQSKFRTVCSRLRDPTTNAGKQVRRVDNTAGEVFCVFDGFEEWLTNNKGLNYPGAFTSDCTGNCVPIEMFRLLISEYSNFLRMSMPSSGGKTSYIQSFGNTGGDTLRFDFSKSVPCGNRSASAGMSTCRPLLMVQLYFNATFKFNSPAAEIDPVLDALDEMLEDVAAGSCSDPSKATQAACGSGTWTGEIAGLPFTHTAVRYIGVETEKVLLRSAVWGSVFSIILATFCILGATQNYLVTAWSILIVMLVVNAVVGSMVMFGWTLGVIESICLTICVGLSVDYTIHLCHIFATSIESTRFGAARDALSSMGISVFNAAITTLGSALVLMFAYVILFERFGIFVFINIFYSCVFSFVSLMAIMMVCGPIQGQGNIADLFGGGSKSDSTGSSAAAPAPAGETTNNPLKKAQEEQDEETET